jgi:hypothetical protein
LSEFIETIKASRTQSPKTILAFFAIVIGLAFAGVTSLSAVLASSPQLIWMVPYVVGFALAVIVGLLVVTVSAMFLDPSKLMLTGISGNEYVAIQRHRVLGDSLGGDQIIVTAVGGETMVLEDLGDLSAPEGELPLAGEEEVNDGQ